MRKYFAKSTQLNVHGLPTPRFLSTMVQSKINQEIVYIHGGSHENVTFPDIIEYNTNTKTANLIRSKNHLNETRSIKK